MNRLPIFLVGIAGLTTVVVGDQGASPTSPPKVATAGIAPPNDASVSAQKPSSTLETPKKELFSGQVIFLSDALKKRKIKSYDEEAKGQVVLETDAGELIPILSDWRGRAFYQDEHLRNRKVELVGFRHPGVPHLAVLMVYTFDEKGERHFTDYWCDICSIPMYEIKPCECCQGPIHLRFTKRDLPDYVQPKSASVGQ